MPSRELSLCLITMSFVLASRLSQADEVDIANVEYVDVVESVEGSIWKGVVTEQAPNVFYKIETADGSVHVIKAYDVVKVTKQRNPKYKTPEATAKRTALVIDPGTEVDT